MNNNLAFPKLFITDLDDSALGGGFKPYSRFPDIFSRFLDNLNDHGCSWATNTTWDVNPQAQLVFSSSVNSRPAYISGGKGLQLCSMQGDELISIQPFTDIMNNRLEEVNKKSLRPFIQEICSKFELKNIIYNGFWFSGIPIESDVVDLLAYVNEKKKVLDSLNFTINTDKPQVAVFPAFLKKADAVKEIIRITKLDPKDIVVAGDGLIDLDMMTEELAGYIICPNNSHDEVKDLVMKRNGVIGTLDCGPGIVEAFGKLAKQNGWNWNFE